MSRLAVILTVSLFSSVAVADQPLERPAQDVLPTGFARKTAGKPPAFDEDRIAKFLMAAEWAPSYEDVTIDASKKPPPALLFVDPAYKGAKLNVQPVAVKDIERRERRTIVNVMSYWFELRPCFTKKTHSCLYMLPDPLHSEDPPAQVHASIKGLGNPTPPAGMTKAPASATTAGSSSKDCAAIAKRLADLETKQIERHRTLQQGLGKSLK